jgi:hypothetical protein
MKKDYLFLIPALLLAANVSAAGELDKAAAGGNKSLNIYAAQMLKAKNYEEALSAYTLLLEKEKSVSGRINLLSSSAKAKLQLEDFGGAVNDLRKAQAVKHPNVKVNAANQLRILLQMTDIYAGKLNDFPRAFGLVEDALKNKELFGTPAAQKVLQARKKALMKSFITSLVKLKKYAEARSLAQKNLEKEKSEYALKIFTEIETLHCKHLMAAKKYAEAEALAQKLLTLKGCGNAFYWQIRAMLMQIKIRKKDFKGAANELLLLKKMPGGSRFNCVMEEVRLLLVMQKSDEAIALLLKSASDSSFSSRERGNFWNSAAYNVLIKNMDVKKAEEYYKKARTLLGSKFRNLLLEKLILRYKNK